MKEKDKPSDEQRDTPSALWPLLRSIFYFALAVLIIGHLAYRHPSVGSFWSFAFLFLLPGGLYQTVRATLLRVRGREYRRGLMIILRLLSIALGWAATIQVTVLTNGLALDHFSERQGELLRSFNGAGVDTICHVFREHQTSHPVALLKGLHHDGSGAYLVTFWGGSIDIDGSTIAYYSSTRDWSITHNDNSERLQNQVTRHISSMQRCLTKREVEARR